MRPRWPAAGMALLGAIVTAAPFATWYHVDVPGRSLTVSGVAAAGELWTLPVLGVVIIGCAIAMLARDPEPTDWGGRWGAFAIVVAATLAVVWAAAAAIGVDAVAIPAVADPPPTPLRTAPWAWITAAAAAATVCVALAWLRAGVSAPGYPDETESR